MLLCSMFLCHSLPELSICDFLIYTILVHMLLVFHYLPLQIRLGLREST